LFLIGFFGPVSGFLAWATRLIVSGRHLRCGGRTHDGLGATLRELPQDFNAVLKPAQLGCRAAACCALSTPAARGDVCQWRRLPPTALQRPRASLPKPSPVVITTAQPACRGPRLDSPADAGTLEPPMPHGTDNRPDMRRIYGRADCSPAFGSVPASAGRRPFWTPQLPPRDPAPPMALHRTFAWRPPEHRMQPANGSRRAAACTLTTEMTIIPLPPPPRKRAVPTVPPFQSGAEILTRPYPPRSPSPRAQLAAPDCCHRLDLPPTCAGSAQRAEDVRKPSVADF
jgi:hypothetical protein